MLLRGFYSRVVFLHGWMSLLRSAQVQRTPLGFVRTLCLSPPSLIDGGDESGKFNFLCILNEDVQHTCERTNTVKHMTATDKEICRAMNSSQNLCISLPYLETNQMSKKNRDEQNYHLYTYRIRCSRNNFFLGSERLNLFVPPLYLSTKSWTKEWNKKVKNLTHDRDLGTHCKTSTWWRMALWSPRSALLEFPIS